MEKQIIKLLKSSYYEDALIGLRLMDELPIKEFRKLLRTEFERIGESHVTWTIKTAERNDPRVESYDYIEGKSGYYYAIKEIDIDIDTKTVAKRMCKTTDMIIIESWK